MEWAEGTKGSDLPRWKFDMKASAVFANLLNDRWLEGNSATPERFRLALNGIAGFLSKYFVFPNSLLL